MLWGLILFTIFVPQSFQSVVDKDEAFPASVRSLISANYEPVYVFHQGFLREVEQRLTQWSVGGVGEG